MDPRDPGADKPDSPGSGRAHSPQDPTMNGPTLSMAHLYADGNGESRFGDVEVPTRFADFAPPAPAAAVSEPKGAARHLFLVLPEGWYGEPHPAPQRQVMALLAGEVEVTTSDGAQRRFRAGTVVLVEDTWGRGHATRVVGPGAAHFSVCQF